MAVVINLVTLSLVRARAVRANGRFGPDVV